eukprot:snap_masked-scaffold_36-processed-gene-2.98-mRNA-1 protein AED:1.00 eAED:1.00 QI:0/-1/0/0/-1/1/1/0/248
MKTLKKKLLPKKRVSPYLTTTESIPETPNDMTEKEYIACQTIEFYTNILVLYAALEDRANQEFTAPGTGFPPNFTFLWIESGRRRPSNRRRDSMNSRRSRIRDDKVATHDGEGELLSGPKYVEKSLQWIDSIFENESIFSMEKSVEFPVDFIDNYICRIFSLLFRVFCIIYHTSYERLRRQKLLEPFFTNLKHFVFFGIRFNLLVTTDEFLAMRAPMRKLQELYIKTWKEHQKKKEMHVEESMFSFDL